MSEPLAVPVGQAPQMQASQLRVLYAVKRCGQASAAQIAKGADMPLASTRYHLGGLATRGLLTQRRVASGGRGRPTTHYSVSQRGAKLLPNADAQDLRGLLEHLLEHADPELTRTYFESQWAPRRERFLARAAALPPDDHAGRLALLNQELEAQGFMPRIEAADPPQAPPAARGGARAPATPPLQRGALKIIATHCPYASTVAVTNAVCELEREFLNLAMGREASEVSIARGPHEHCCFTYPAAGGA